jgi:hypothetical protein
MEKDALLGIILSDVQEVETLLNSFKGKSVIKPAFIKLTLQKVDNIKHELELLRDLADEDESVAEVQKSVDAATPWVSKTVEAEPIADKIATKQTDTLDLEPAATPIVNQFVDAPVAAEKATVVPPPIDPIPDVKPIAPVEVVVEKPADEIVQPQVPHPPKHTPTLGESLVTDKSSVLDKIHAINQTSNPALIGKPVDDIKKAIGLNDRFLYQRELFDNNPSLMNQTLDALNAMGSFGDALSFVKTNFTWDDDDDTTQSFMNLVHRKFK